MRTEKNRVREWKKGLVAVVVCAAMVIAVLSMVSVHLRSPSGSSPSSSIAGAVAPLDPLTLSVPETLTLSSPNAQFGGYFGTAVAVNGSTAVVGAPYETLAMNPYAGHAYVLNASTGALICTLTSPNPTADGNFGESVAITGTTVVVGAPYETATGLGSAGHAYVFDAATCGLTSTLTSPNVQSGGEFGWSVAVSGTSVAVGAPHETASGYSDAGHAYVLKASTGATISTLTSSSPQTDGVFGDSVAISGSKVMVGAPEEMSSGYSEAGNSYLFAAATGALKLTLSSGTPQTGGAFGWSVAMTASDLLAGAPGESAKGYTGAGNAYLLKGSNGALLATLTSPNAQTYGSFGASVALVGKTAVVGANYETVSSTTYAGHAYVFDASSGAEISALTSLSPQTNGYFGASVATNGTAIAIGAPDEKAAGYGYAGHAYLFPMTTGERWFGGSIAFDGPFVVVGAPLETVAGYADAGEAYVFDATTGGLITALSNPGPQTDGQFGASVGVSGYTVVVGTKYYSVSGVTYAGRAYIFNATAGNLLLTLDSPKPETDGHFGWSVAINGTDVLVGAPFEKSKGVSSAGNAYVFDAGTGSLISTLKSPSPITFGEFGYSVAISGSLAVVGAPGESVSGLAGAGDAHVYKASTGALLSSPTSATPQTGGAFGYSVGISGTTAVVGAPDETGAGYTLGGNAYLFKAKTAVLIASLASPNAIASEAFGFSVAISGSTVVVGAPGETASGFLGAGNASVWTSAGALVSAISSPNAQTNGDFGYAVATNGTAEAVGAPLETASGYVEAGNAYVFT